jgi:hypothetical protein
MNDFAGSLALDSRRFELTFMSDTSNVAEWACESLEHATSGRWHEIKTVEGYPIKLKATRALVIIRHLLSAGVAVSVALISYVYLRHLTPHFYLQAIVITCFGFATAQVFTLMDPNSSVAFDTATKIGEMFRRS